MGATHAVRTLLGAAHPGPALAVTLLAVVLCAPAEVSPGPALLVVLAVGAGQLSIGWSNDLVDVRRDRAVGRTDKPLAAGTLAESTVRSACGLAVVVSVVASLLLGATAGLLLLVVVVAGWAYNLGLKSTRASFAPYAVAFGALPLGVWAAGSAPGPDRVVVLGGALLGVGAHLLNAVPDLTDDEATGVLGLPHRLGALRSRVLAAGLLALASLALALRVGDLSTLVRALAVAVVLALSLAAVATQGRRAFRAAVAIAVVDVALLAVAR